MRLALVVSNGSQGFEGAPAAIAEGWFASRPGTVTISAPHPETWPFTYPLTLDLPASPAIVWMPAIHEAFVNHQTDGTRLVTTQAAYMMQVWLDAIAGRDILLVASADRAKLVRHAPEVLSRNAVFADAVIQEVHDSGPARPVSSAPEVPAATTLLSRAFRVSDPAERLSLCVRALEQGRTPAALLATASACMEVNDLDAATRDLEEAIAQAPDWAAAHFERGKLWLRVDDMERASESFQQAARLMPRFGPAWSNLGATLGELDRPADALAAFEQALACDPGSTQALNNIGVVKRELGKLAESEAAFRGVIQRAPDLAFGHYNLGHTLFLQGRYQAALSAYVEGQKRDPERNAVQASRLALCRLAAGDPGGALTDLKRATNGLPSDYRRQLLADTNAIAWALLTHRHNLAGWKQVSDWLSGELAKYT